MLTSIRRWRHLLAPATGVVFLTLWIVAEAGRDDLAAKIVVTGLFAIAIGLSARVPTAALVLAFLTPALQCVGWILPPTSTTWPTFLAVPIVVGVVGAGRSATARYLALPVILGASVLEAWAMAIPTAERPDVWGLWIAGGLGPRHDLLVLTLVFVGVGGIAWGVGVGVGSAWRIAAARSGLARAEARLEEAGFELLLADDRARIARDVHDSLAHSLAVVVAQAQGAAALPVGHASARQALDDIGEVARDALVDVRRLVERIRDDEVATPRATLADLPELVGGMRELGMDVTLVGLGEPVGLGASQELAVFRIVQESTTNALKHGGLRSEVSVVLEWRGPGLAVFVTSYGGSPLVDDVAPGVGIHGMVERARLAGGWLRAAAGDPERSADGLEERIPFVVTAWVPGHAAGHAVDRGPALGERAAVGTGA